MSTIEEGISRAVLGITSRTIILTDDERRTVAFHEAGHALVALALGGGTPPHKLSIVPRGDSLGHCVMLDTQDRVIVSRSMLIDQMASTLGGMVAEEMAFGESGSGTSADLERASEIARRMVRRYGLSESLGPVSYPDGMDMDGTPRSYSDEANSSIDAEVRRFVGQAKERASAVLSHDDLERVALALLEKESLSGDELAAIVGVKQLRRARASKAGANHRSTKPVA